MKPSNGYVLAVDQSTQASKVVLFDALGSPVCRVTKPHEQIYPASGLVEHDPMEILENVLEGITETVRQSGVQASAIKALSITNQRETILAWDEATGRPVHNALVWQDERGHELCEQWEAAGYAPRVKEATGIKLDPFFSASKLAWLVRESSTARLALRRGSLMAGTMDSWLIWNLTGRKVFASDYSNASRTMLFNIGQLAWDSGLIERFGLQGVRLPEPRCSDSVFGTAEVAGLGLRLPIAGVMGDSHAALFGHCGWGIGDAKATYGTGSSLMCNIGKEPRNAGDGLTLSVAWGLRDQADYVFEGNIQSTGYTLRWLRDNLGLFQSYDEAERMAVEAGNNGGVYLVPAFSGLGAPHWEHGIRAILTGLSHSSDRRHLVRAGLESIAFQIADLVSEMDRRSAVPLAHLHVDGGPTRNAFLMQFQADILGIPVIVPDLEELSALGVAYMGGVATGVWADFATVQQLPVKTTVYQPRMAVGEREGLLIGWRSAVKQAISRKSTMGFLEAKMAAPIVVTEAPLDSAAIRAAALDPSAGAVVLFEGCARDSHEGRPVALLAYEAFVPMAEAELARLREEAMARFGLVRCLIHHRLGEVPLLEAAVVVAAASPHRREAFEAAAWIMDRIKERVPIWKRERYQDGAQTWVEGESRK